MTTWPQEDALDVTVRRVSIGGRVSADDRPRSGAVVTARSAHVERSAVSDSRGFFWFENLPPATYAVQAVLAAAGARERRSDVQNVESRAEQGDGQPPWIDLVLMAAAPTRPKGE